MRNVLLVTAATAWLVLLVAQAASAQSTVVVMQPGSYYDPAMCATVPVTGGLYYCQPAPTPTPVPTATPTRPAPVAGQTCPDWVHASYTTTGADGRTYPTWHPQKDPTYGCYFGHEHGSNPALYGSVKPPFGMAGYHMGMVENHTGFKVYVVDNDTAGHRWMFVHHFNTSAAARTCVRHHEVQVYADGKAALDFLGDFGVSEDNTGAVLYTPGPASPACTQTVNNYASRLIPRTDLQQFGYEPWKFDIGGTQLNLSSIITFNTRNIQFACSDANCQQSTMQQMWHYDYTCSCYLPNSGAQRFIQVGAGCGSGCGYPLTISQGYGAFCTDATGRGAHTGACSASEIPQNIDAGYSAAFPWLGTNAKFAMQQIDGPFVLEDFNGGELDNNLDGKIAVPN